MEDPKKSYLEPRIDKIEHPDDETPPAAAVEDRQSGPPSRPSNRPGAISKVVAAAAIGTIVATTALHEKHGPKTPRPSDVKGTKEEDKTKIRKRGEQEEGAGGTGPTGGPAPGGPGEGGDAGLGPIQEDLCGEESFAQDLSKDKIPASNANPCQFVTAPDGKTHIIGHTLLDSEGRPRDCFLTEPWADNAALKIRGEVYGSPDEQGKIYFKNGKLCVTMLDPAASEKTETVVEGEAALHISTNSKVLVKLMEPKPDPQSGQLMHFARVYPVAGETLVSQDGRKEQYKLKEGDQPMEIPLDILHAENTGCYIATPRQSGDFESQKGGAYMLGAGAIFLILRRRQRKMSKAEV